MHTYSRVPSTLSQPNPRPGGRVFPWPPQRLTPQNLVLTSPIPSELSSYETTAHQISGLAAIGLSDLLVCVGPSEVFTRDSLGLITYGPRRSYGVARTEHFTGSLISHATQAGFERILVVGHLNTLTGSGLLPPGMAALITSALAAGADLMLLHRLLGCASTDQAMTVLLNAGLLADTMNLLERHLQTAFDYYATPGLRLEWVCFAQLSDIPTLVAQSPDCLGLVRRWHRD